MQQMRKSRIQQHYNNNHFGNEPVEVGNVCWVRMQDGEGLHEFPVEVIPDPVLDTTESFETIFGTVKPQGNSAMVQLPKRLIGRQVKVLVLEYGRTEKMDIEKSVILKYKDVEIRAKVEMGDEDVNIMFWNPNNGSWTEHVGNTFSGWSYQEDTLNDEMRQLIEFVKEMDEQWFADADEGQIYTFDEDGSISS